MADEVTEMGVIGTTEAARRLKLSTGRLRTMIASRILKAQKLGHDWAIDEADIERLQKIERKRGRPPKKS